MDIPFFIGSVGAGQMNDPDDVRTLADNLSNIGYSDAKGAPSAGVWSFRLEDATRRFQRDWGLTVDGITLPHGETHEALKSIASMQLRKKDAHRGEHETNEEESHSLRDERWRGTVNLPENDSRPSSVPTVADAFDKPFQADYRSGINADFPVRRSKKRVVSFDEAAQILEARGFRYRPDPMGRLEQGDWIDDSGRSLSDPDKLSLIHESEHSRQQYSEAGKDADGDNRRKDVRIPLIEELLVSHGLDKEQRSNFSASPLGVELRKTFSILTAGQQRDGTTLAPHWQSEFRRLGIEPESRFGVQLAEAGNPKSGAPPSRSWNFGTDAEVTAHGIGLIWKWLTQDIKPLADIKQGSLRPIDETIRALEKRLDDPNIGSLERWHVLSTLARLKVSRSKINIAFPSSPLDLATLGISAIGIIQVGNRAVPLFRQGNKVFDADDIAKGAWQRIKPVEKLDEYSAAEWRLYLEQKYGKENVTSITIPSLDSQWFARRNSQHPTTNIWYDERGFPIFDPVVIFDTRLGDRVKWTKKPRDHGTDATLQLKEAVALGQVDRSKFAPDQLAAIEAGATSIPRLRWHHHQEYGRMQLVPADIHTKTTHIGGTGMIKGQ